MPSKLDLTGEIFGNLIVLRPHYNKRDSRNSTTWVCQCSCSKEIIVSTKYLREGAQKSCGCMSKNKPKETIIDSVLDEVDDIIAKVRSGENESQSNIR